jgi:hypothetical protein
MILAIYPGQLLGDILRPIRTSVIDNNNLPFEFTDGELNKGSRLTARRKSWRAAI